MSTTEKIKETLEKKAGPLKVWQWGAIGVGGVAVFLVMRGGSGGGAGAGITPADAALPAGDIPTPEQTLAQPVDPAALPVFPETITVAPQPPAPVVMFVTPETTTTTTTQPDHVKTVAAQPTTETISTPGGIATTYIPPSLTTPAEVAAGGPVYRSPTTSNAFVSPFQGPTASEIMPVAESPAAGLAQPGSQIELVGGVPISLSAAAIARGGIPAIDIPLNPTPPSTITIPVNHPAAG